jgi:hypothetical protein
MCGIAVLLLELRLTTLHRSQARVQRGGLSHVDYANTVLFNRGSRATLARLAQVTLVTSSGSRCAWPHEEPCASPNCTQANKFDVVGGVSRGELALLTPVYGADRSYLVQTWLVRLITQRLLDGGLTIHPAILGRVYQVRVLQLRCPFSGAQYGFS